MINCFKCEKCGKVFDNYEDASKHEDAHYTVKTWADTQDEEVIRDNTVYSETSDAPIAVVVPMTRTVYDEETTTWTTDTIYLQYWADKRPVVQVFPIDKNLLTE